MKNFEPKETDFIGDIKKQTRTFIFECKTLSVKQKNDLIAELGYNFIDDRFNGETFIESAIDYAMRQWIESNRDLMDYWKQIALANAAISNDPWLTANMTIEQLQEEFNLKP